MKTKMLLLVLFCAFLAVGRECPPPVNEASPSWIDPNLVIGDLLCVKEGLWNDPNTGMCYFEACDEIDGAVFSWVWASDKITDFGYAVAPDSLTLKPVLTAPGIYSIYLTLESKVGEDTEITTGTVLIRAFRRPPVIIPHCGGG